MKSDTVIAVEWLWSLRGKEMWLTPGVLTAENKDPASPNLTTVEAVSLFRYLLEKGLIFPDVRDGHPVFRLHESKIQEWNLFIEHLGNDLRPEKKAFDQNKTKETSTDKSDHNQEDSGSNKKFSFTWLFGTVAFAAIEGGLAWFCWYFSDVLEKHNCPKWCEVSLFFAGVFILVLIHHAVYRAWQQEWPKTAFKVWISCAALVALLLLFFLAIPAKPAPTNAAESKSEPAPTVLVLSPQSPPSGQGFAVSASLDFVIVSFGSSSFATPLPKCPPGQTAVWNPNVPFIGEYMTLRWDGSHLFLDFEWYPMFGLPAFKLERNNLIGLPRNWDCNHTDRAIEIVNDKQIPIVQIYFKDDAHLVLNGVFTTPTDIFFASEAGTVNMNHAGKTKDISHVLNQQYFDAHLDELRLKPLFKYPSWKFMGQFSENSN